MKQQKIWLIMAILLVTGVSGWWAWPWSADSSAPSPPSQSETKEQKKPTPEPAATTTTRSATQPGTLAAAPRFRPRPGETLAFQIKVTSDSQIDFSFITPTIGGMGGQGVAPGRGQKTPLSQQSDGELYLKYYPLGPGRWGVGARFSGLNHQINGKSPGYSQLLDHPFAFEMNETGFLTDFRFTPGFSPKARQFVQQILYGLQTVLPEKPKSTWHTRELNMTGRYRAKYSLESQREDTLGLNKQKTEYFALKVAEHEINPALSQASMVIEQSKGKITVPWRGAWFLDLELEEKTTSLAQGYAWGESDYRLSARRIERDLQGIFSDTFQGFLEQLQSDRYIKDKYYLTDPEWDRLGEHLDLSAALDLFGQLKNADTPNAQRNAEKFLVNYLRQYPRTAFALVDALDADPRRERFDQNTHLILWRLLTEAGHGEAQQAVLGALLDPARGHVTHLRALAYISDFEYPETATVRALWDFHQGLGLPRDKSEREFKTMSLYALGALGNENKLNQGVKSEIQQMLTESLARATDPDQQVAGLGAVGNYGDAKMLDTLEPYFSRENENVRAAAYKALRQMEGSQVLDTLARHYATEQSPAVRAAAARAVSKMTPSPEVVAWAGRAALAGETPEEQVPLVATLGKNLEDYPHNEIQLRALLKKNPSNQVKREIYKYIPPE